MSVQRYTTADGKVRYRARVKHHGREVANRVFDRKRDAEAWEEEQKRKLRLGEWHDPRRGRVALSVVAADWLDARHTLKQKSQALELMVWKRHIEPKFGKVPVAAITKSDAAMWVGRLVADGLSPSSASRYLGVFRRLLAFAVEDGRITVNVATTVKPPTAGHVSVRVSSSAVRRFTTSRPFAPDAMPSSSACWHCLVSGGVNWLAFG